VSNLTPKQQTALDSAHNSLMGIESTTKSLCDMLKTGRITISDPSLKEQYVKGLLIGQIGLSHLIKQSLKTLGE
jgi:hypothetical protein